MTNSAWTAYQVGTQWHEAFFDDPTSLYQIASLATGYGLRGVGAWALGMEGTDPAMLSALNGVAPAIHYATPAAPSSSHHDHCRAPPSAAARADPPRRPLRRAPHREHHDDHHDAHGPFLRRDVQGRVARHHGERQSVTCCSHSSPERHALRGGDAVGAERRAARHRCLPRPASRLRPRRPAGLSPPFAGATVAGVISGLVVQNDAALSCLANANQSAELGVPSAVTTTPELVVWQWPGNPQYDYVVATTTPSGSTAADCANATLAFPVP